MRSTFDREKAAEHLRPMKASGPFANFGEFLRRVDLAVRRQIADQRLVRAPAGMGETDPSGGGFVVPEQFASKLIEPLYIENPVAALCDRWPTAYTLGSTKIPGIDETSRADGSRWGGATSYWPPKAIAFQPPSRGGKTSNLAPRS